MNRGWERRSFVMGSVSGFVWVRSGAIVNPGPCIDLGAYRIWLGRLTSVILCSYARLRRHTMMP